MDGDFKSATVEQLEKILAEVDTARTNALDLLIKWVEGEWEPQAYDMPHIEWLIIWLGMQDKNGR